MQTQGSPYATYYCNPTQDPQIVKTDLINALRKRVRYVFVLFQENRSFDHYFGSFPGANGLFSDGVNPRTAAKTPGLAQPIVNVDGSAAVQMPFLIGPTQHAADSDDIDHGHVRMVEKMDLPRPTGTPPMDMFSRVEEAKYTPAGQSTPALQATRQVARRQGLRLSPMPAGVSGPGHQSPHCPARLETSQKLGRHRWVVERTFAWLNRFRRLAIRYERRLDIHHVFTALACSVICLRKLVQRF